MRKLLIANRGEIARRVIRTARAMGIFTVALYSDADRYAPHVRDADEAVHLPGNTPTETYLDVDRVLAAGVRTGADAVHPGYGFLSENAAFARACARAGITFVGPSPEAIEMMGSKIAAKELMAAAGVPILGADGFPLLVKAAFGGGGRGMRIVRDQSELAEALAAAEREAAAAFGNGTVFVERYIEAPRHIEVQIFGDSHGNLIHLFERECSIQRRYQKVIEEAPSPAVDPELRERLCDAALTAGRALAYVGAGTVEFVLGPDKEFFFLEVNTRLQVEHAVTEAVTGLDLVELQLRVARGEALDLQPSLSGWAIEARLYAEDVPAGFVPVSGRIDHFAVPAEEGIRVDSGYESGSEVSTFYDAMLAKVISWGATRDQAIARLAGALGRTRIAGVTTNQNMLVATLRHPDFIAGAIDTGFLSRHPQLTAASAADPSHAIAAALAAQARRRAGATAQATLPSGWRNVAAHSQRATFTADGVETCVEYAFGRGGLRVEVDGAAVDVVLYDAGPGGVDMEVAGVRGHYEVAVYGLAVHVHGPAASSALVEVERLPIAAASVAAGSLLAPLPGLVVRVLVEPGEEVAAGQPLVVLEAMKMEHTIACPAAGVAAAVLVGAGDQVELGQVLVIVEVTDG